MYYTRALYNNVYVGRYIFIYPDDNTYTEFYTLFNVYPMSTHFLGKVYGTYHIEGHTQYLCLYMYTCTPHTVKTLMKHHL